MSYAEAFKSLRHAYKLTQAEFAELLQVSKPTIQKLEAGDYPPSEKMTARLAELFRSERFRTELRPRVEAGDLRFVGMAFGALLEFVDANDAAVPPALAASPESMAGVYEDLKKDHAEFLAMMRSQQDTIHNLSESTNNLSVSTKSLSESTKSFAASTQNLSETSRSLAESNKSLTECLSKGRILQQCL